MDKLLDKHAPYRKLNKYKRMLKTKPWITPAIEKSILIKNILFKKHIKLSDPLINQEVQLKCKYYRILIHTILKKSKQNYYEKFFQNNLNDIKKIWKGIRNLISLKQSDCLTIVKQYLIIKNINVYFSSIAGKLNSQINSLHIFSTTLWMIYLSLLLQIIRKSKI